MGPVRFIVIMFKTISIILQKDKFSVHNYKTTHIFMSVFFIFLVTLFTWNINYLINLFVSDGCFQAPICIDQSGLYINDTHNIGEELYTMIVLDPTDQFAGQPFTGLYFSINSSSLDVAAINHTTGRLIQLNLGNRVCERVANSAFHLFLFVTV